jgi:hypothetical protein
LRPKRFKSKSNRCKGSLRSRCQKKKKKCFPRPLPNPIPQRARGAGTTTTSKYQKIMASTSKNKSRVPPGFNLNSLVFSKHELGETFVANQRAITKLQEARRRSQDDITRRVTAGEPITVGAAMVGFTS